MQRWLAKDDCRLFSRTPCRLHLVEWYLFRQGQTVDRCVYFVRVCSKDGLKEAGDAVAKPRVGSPGLRMKSYRPRLEKESGLGLVTT